MALGWLRIVGVVVIVLVATGVWFFWQARESAQKREQAYRQDVLDTLLDGDNKEGDPGLGTVIHRLDVDLNCRDEDACLGSENFSYVHELAQKYEIYLANYHGHICEGGKLHPGPADKADHEQLCADLDHLLRDVRGVETNALVALNLLTQGNPAGVKNLLRQALKRILNHRERILVTTESLHKISWLEPLWKDKQK